MHHRERETREINRAENARAFKTACRDAFAFARARCEESRATGLTGACARVSAVCLSWRRQVWQLLGTLAIAAPRTNKRRRHRAQVSWRALVNVRSCDAWLYRGALYDSRALARVAGECSNI